MGSFSEGFFWFFFLLIPAVDLMNHLESSYFRWIIETFFFLPRLKRPIARSSFFGAVLSLTLPNLEKEPDDYTTPLIFFGRGMARTPHLELDVKAWFCDILSLGKWSLGYHQPSGPFFQFAPDARSWSQLRKKRQILRIELGDGSHLHVFPRFYVPSCTILYIYI